MFEGDAGRRAVSQWIRDRETAKAEKENNSSGLLPEMTPAIIKQCAMANDGYETPELNDKLYLHFKGFRKMQNLEPYTELKGLWLDSNGLQKIENLGHLSNLRCLFLNNNLINQIEGLEGLTSLVSLDISQNRIFKVQGLSCLPSLQTLNIARNYLETPESIDELTGCKSLTNVDLSNNNLQDAAVIDVLASIPKVVALNMNGNPVVNNTPQFRKKMVCANKSLLYLDRPVFELERITAEAWQQGGREGEVAARNAYNEQKKAQDRAQVPREF